MVHFSMSWEAPEFEYREREISWYWLTIIVAAAMVAFAVWQRDFLFGFFIIIAEVLAIIWANRLPRLIEFSVSDREFLIDGRKRIGMSELESFSADEVDEEYADLMLHFRGRLRTPIFVKIPIAKLEEFRAHVRPILREVEHRPSFIDALEKLIGF